MTDDEDDILDDIEGIVDEMTEVVDSSSEVYPLLKEHTGYSREFNHLFMAYDSALSGTEGNDVLPMTGSDGIKGPEDVVELPNKDDIRLDLKTEFAELVEEDLSQPFDVAIDAAEASLESNLEAREKAEKGNIQAARTSYSDAVNYLSDAATAADAMFSSGQRYLEEVRDEIGQKITPNDDISVRQNLRQAERNLDRFSTLYANEIIHSIQSELRRTAEEYIDDKDLISDAYKAAQSLEQSSDNSS